MEKKLGFNNRAIRNYKATFISGKGNSKDRDYAPFNICKTTQYKGLYLCKYKKGKKHFVSQFYIKSTGRLRRFTVGRFIDNLNVITGETIQTSLSKITTT
tara:strand:+ start:828 stop:1127 length:300 start_codon:yes stop_codon:yes gene_type:complete